MIKDWSVGTKSWLVLYWKRVLLFGGGGILVVMTLIQVFYPVGNLLPFASIDGVKLSGWSKTDAIATLDAQYDQATIGIYFGASRDAYRTPKSGAIGVDVSNAQRVNQLNYPWYLRLAPGSLLWGHFVVRASDTLTYSRNAVVRAAYIKKELGDSCSVLPKNASLNIIDSQLALQKSSNGGTCTVADVTKKLASAKFSLKSDVSVTIPVKVSPPTVSNSDAQAVADKVSHSISQGIAVRAGDGTVLIPRDQLVSWLDFAVVDGKLDYTFNIDRASAYLDILLAAKVAVAAGVTTVSTHDFVETSRQVGSNGQTLDKAGTLAGLKSYVAGTAKEVVAATAVVAPSITYTRTYSPSNVGLSALMKYYAEAHPGTYGVTLIELSGQYRRASYNGDQSFTTASTYKLFVAYSTLLRVESGAWQWTDQIQGGRDLATCFDDMIVKSDNACGEALLTKVGYTDITNEAHAIGCTSTSFLGKDGVKTTPNDLALLLALIQTGQVLGQQPSRDRLIDAMKRNVYRQGIPKGVSAVVADKIGFMDALLHDAAIVYGPTGPYVLTIMTDGSSWANIADLTRQIEALRVQ
jgi:beta-lactamase class A